MSTPTSTSTTPLPASARPASAPQPPTAAPAPAAEVGYDANSKTIAAELAKGRLPIVQGTIIKDDGRTYGGHNYVVTKIENGKVYITNPWGQRESFSEDEFKAHLTDIELPV